MISVSETKSVMMPPTKGRNGNNLYTFNKSHCPIAEGKMGVDDKIYTL